MTPLAPQPTCPECDSPNVVQVIPVTFGVLECLDCHTVWNEESMPENAHDRAPHKAIRKMRKGDA